MKKPTDKLSTFLGHNNPPEDIKSIEFTNSAIESLLLSRIRLILNYEKINSTFHRPVFMFYS